MKTAFQTPGGDACVDTSEGTCCGPLTRFTKSCPLRCSSTMHTSRKRTSCKRSNNLEWPNAVSLNSRSNRVRNKRFTFESVTAPSSGLHSESSNCKRHLRASSHEATGREFESVLEHMGCWWKAHCSLTHSSECKNGTSWPS